MKVREMMDNPAAEGREVTIEGIFVMQGGVGYFVESDDDVDNVGGAIYVDQPGLREALLSSVPAYAGSKYSYRNEAKISGVVRRGGREGFRYEISNIRDFYIFMCGQSMCVEL